MIFADEITNFASDEKVRQYQRIQNGRLVTVNQYQRKGDPKAQQTIEEKTLLLIML